MTNDNATNDSAQTPYDAILLVSFGGPEGPDDVLPFLENVLRGRNVPRERMLEVARHYDLFGGVSPINDQNRALIAAVRAELKARPDLPIYWGNRNWRPGRLGARCARMGDGMRWRSSPRPIALFELPAVLEDIARAQEEIGLMRRESAYSGSLLIIPASSRRTPTARAALDTLPNGASRRRNLYRTQHPRAWRG